MKVNTNQQDQLNKTLARLADVKSIQVVNDSFFNSFFYIGFVGAVGIIIMLMNRGVLSNSKAFLIGELLLLAAVFAIMVMLTYYKLTKNRKRPEQKKQEQEIEDTLKNITDQDILFSITLDNRFINEVRQFAARKLTNQSFLVKTAKNPEVPYCIRETAVQNITDHNQIVEIIQNNEVVTKVAKKRLIGLSINKPNGKMMFERRFRSVAVLDQNYRIDHWSNTGITTTEYDLSNVMNHTLIYDDEEYKKWERAKRLRIPKILFSLALIAVVIAIINSSNLEYFIVPIFFASLFSISSTKSAYSEPEFRLSFETKRMIGIAQKERDGIKRFALVREEEWHKFMNSLKSRVTS